MLPYKKPKIAILTIRNTYNYGGVLSMLKVVYSFCEQYFEPKVFFLGFDPEIATSLRACKFTSRVKPISFFGMNCIEIGARWSFWEPGHYSFTYHYWKDLLEDFDYIFVVSGTSMAAHPALILNKKFTMWLATPYKDDRLERVKQLSGIRYVLNKLAQGRMNRLEKQILNKAGYIWALSTYAQAKFQSIMGQHKETMTLCGFPIDCSKVPQLSPKDDERIILAVGRFSDPRKNVDMLIRVFNQLHTQMPDLKLYIVGKKPSDEKLLAYADMASFANITFTGQVTIDDLYSLYNRAHLLLITSYQEGLGIVGLEALLHGTPVIATDCGGTRDFIINNVTGYLVPINNDEEMVARARYLLSNPAISHQFSLRGRHLIEERFSVEKIYALFKQGLRTTYPNLETWFEDCDHQQALLKERNINIHYSQDME
jgi:glycosyltransferase involved in cell wall biosynthesis